MVFKIQNTRISDDVIPDPVFWLSVCNENLSKYKNIILPSPVEISPSAKGFSLHLNSRFWKNASRTLNPPRWRLPNTQFFNFFIIYIKIIYFLLLENELF